MSKQSSLRKDFREFKDEQHYDDLTKMGKLLVKILDNIDPNHCEATRVYGLVLALKKLRLKRK